MEQIGRMGSSLMIRDDASSPKPHAVCLPYPAQGHITPMLSVAKLLHARGFDVTFVNTEYNHARLVRARGADDAVAGIPGFRFATIPDGLPPSDDDDDVTQDIPSLCRSTSETCLAPFRRLLAELNGGHPPVSCIVSDLAMGFSMDAANELGLPYVQLWTASTISLLAYHHYRLLLSRGLAPLKDMEQLTNGYLDTAVEDVPGLRNMRFRDFPSFSRTSDANDLMVRSVLQDMRRSMDASAVIVNSFDELEGEAVTALEALGMARKVYTIGPLSLVGREDPPTPRSSIKLDLWKEEDECMRWLDGREQPGSVVYVNFGSIAVMTKEQMVEFAWGLAKSGVHFLWIIRRDIVRVGDDTAAAMLPPEFLAETAGRGLMASWCPQQEVLNHPAVGAFLTHSGWNSTMDTMCAGVPVISWPFFADQQTNCRYQCNEWGVGMEIDNNVQREVVASLIVRLMEGDQGRQMRRKAQEWKDKAVKAAEPTGSSN